MRNLVLVLLSIGISLAIPLAILHPLVRKPKPDNSIAVGNQYLPYPTNGYSIIWVTNGSGITNRPVIETDYQQGMRVGEEIGFKDGVFWGSFACFRGNPTNMVDAETIAYRMRREAIKDWEAHKRAMTNQ